MFPSSTPERMSGGLSRALNQQLLDFGDIVVGEKSLLPTEPTRPPSRLI